MNEPEIVNIDDNYMEDLVFSTEFVYNQFQVDEKTPVNYTYEQEDWMSSCF